MRWLLFSLAAFLIIGPSLARADQAEPSCETVTSVRCTGSAAPLALSGANAAAPVNIAPPVGTPPEAPPAVGPPVDGGACCGPSAALPTILALPHNWTLGRDENGQLYAAVMKRVPRTSVWVPGLVLWLSSYLGTAAIGGMLDQNPIAAIPIFGGFTSAIVDAFGDGNAVAKSFGYTMGSMLQIGGMVTFIVGMAGGHKLERLPVKIGPGGIYGTF